MRTPFGITLGQLGTDTARLAEEAGYMKVINDPFTGRKVLAVKAIRPNVAIIHAQKADAEGDILIEEPLMPESMFAEAADKVIITAEEIVSADEMRKNPHKVSIPGYLVSAIAHMPFGAYPTSCAGHYLHDDKHLTEYVGLVKTPEQFKTYLDKYILKTKSHEEFLEIAGGEARLFEITDLSKNMLKPEEVTL